MLSDLRKREERFNKCFGEFFKIIEKAGEYLRENYFNFSSLDYFKDPSLEDEEEGDEEEEKEEKEEEEEEIDEEEKKEKKRLRKCENLFFGINCFFHKSHELLSPFKHFKTVFQKNNLFFSL